MITFCMHFVDRKTYHQQRNNQKSVEFNIEESNQKQGPAFENSETAKLIKEEKSKIGSVCICIHIYTNEE